MYSEKAFHCNECPKKSGDGGCPGWWQTMKQNIQTGESAIEENCAFVVLPFLLTEVIKASNRPAAAISQMRNDIICAISGVQAKREIENKIIRG